MLVININSTLNNACATSSLSLHNDMGSAFNSLSKLSAYDTVRVRFVKLFDLNYISSLRTIMNENSARIRCTDTLAIATIPEIIVISFPQSRNTFHVP